MTIFIITQVISTLVSDNNPNKMAQKQKVLQMQLNLNSSELLWPICVCMTYVAYFQNFDKNIITRTPFCKEYPMTLVTTNKNAVVSARFSFSPIT